MKRFLIIFACLALFGCGSSTSSTTTQTTISGIAATGAPITGRVFLKDAANHELFQDTTDGTFSFVTTTLTPPFVLKAEWNDGSPRQLFSFAATSGRANITPLTQVIVQSAAHGNDLPGIYAAPGMNSLVSIAATIPAVTTALRTSLHPLFVRYGADADPFTSYFAPNHAGMDQLLDDLQIANSNGMVTISDMVSGQLLFMAPVTDLNQAITTTAWSMQEANVANDPDVATDAFGNILTVWSENIQGRYHIRARLLNDTAPPNTISTSGDAWMPRVAFDAAGNAIAVWAQYENNRTDIWGSRYSAATASWTSPQRISNPQATASAANPDLGVDGSGNAVVAWYQGDGRNNHFDVWAARYTASLATWTGPAMISDGVNSAYGCKVAVNADGKGLIAWQRAFDDGTQTSNGPTNIWGRSITTGNTNGTSYTLNAVAGDVGTVYGELAVAMDPAGNGAVLWVQGTAGSTFLIHAARYAATNGWQTSQIITAGTQDTCYGPHLAFAANGDAVAVWHQQTGELSFTAANHYTAGVGWGTSGKISADFELANSVDNQNVTVDAAGNATVIWSQQTLDPTTGTLSIHSAQFSNAGGWGSAQTISATPMSAGTAYAVVRAANSPTGQAYLVWGLDYL